MTKALLALVVIIVLCIRFYTMMDESELEPDGSDPTQSSGQVSPGQAKGALENASNAVDALNRKTSIRSD